MASDALKTPPRFVPTLTEVVQPSPVTAQGLPPAQVSPSELLPESARVSLEALEDQILHRVMQRVDLSLERLLRDSMAAMLLQHTQTLMPQLRVEIECVVRLAVAQAVAEGEAARPT